MQQLIEKKELQLNQQKQATKFTKNSFLKGEATSKRLFELHNTKCCYSDQVAADTFKASKKHAPELLDAPEREGLEPEASKTDWQVVLAAEKQAKRIRELTVSSEDRKRFDMHTAQKRIDNSHLSDPDKQAIKGQVLRHLLLEEP